MFIVFFPVAIIILSSLFYLLLDYLGPETIYLKPDKFFGLSCSRANDLIVQDYDHKGNLWATRGLLIYYLRNGETKFRKIARVPTGFSFFWLNNFKVIRKFTVRPECVEMLVGDDDHICAFSSGRMWISKGIGERFQCTMKLVNYGIRTGRGIMSSGLMKVKDREFFFGEYFSNPKRQNVRIYKYIDERMSWEPVYAFQPGQICHIHSLQSDPYTGKLWICTGDEDREALIGWSSDNLKTIVPIGQGSQKWRACQLVFTEEAVYWGADTGSVDLCGIYKWDRNNRGVSHLHSIPGAIFYSTRLANGTIVMSTDREGFLNEKDEKTRLLIINADKVATIDCGTWNIKKPRYRLNFAKLRFQRSQGSNKLAISCLNQKEITDGTLFIISEEEVN